MSNEVVIAKLDEVHKYLNIILIELIQAGASHGTLHEFIAGQQRINDCYIHDSEPLRTGNQSFGSGIIMGPMMPSQMRTAPLSDIRFGGSVVRDPERDSYVQGNDSHSFREERIRELIDIVSHFDFTEEEKIKVGAALQHITSPFTEDS